MAALVRDLRFLGLTIMANDLPLFDQLLVMINKFTSSRFTPPFILSGKYLPRGVGLFRYRPGPGVIPILDSGELIMTEIGGDIKRFNRSITV